MSIKTLHTPAKTLAVILCVVALGGGCAKQEVSPDTSTDTSGYSDYGWAKYSAANGNFTAEFPIFPTYSQDALPLNEEGDTFNYEAYSAETASALYSVGVYYYPAELDLSDVDARLQGAVDGMVSSTGGSIVSTEYGYYDSYRSISYTIGATDGLELRGLAAVVDHTVYQLLNVYAAANYNEADFQHFIEAFELSK